jgi:hypothetical protein
MKKFIYTLLIFFSVQTAFAQDEDTDPARLKGKMVEYIENKLGLSKTEAEKFQPLFMDYLKELRQTKEEHGNDKLVLQQKVIEIRLKFRDQIKPLSVKSEATKYLPMNANLWKKCRRPVKTGCRSGNQDHRLIKEKVSCKMIFPLYLNLVFFIG